jgi:hypothetical protein
MDAARGSPADPASVADPLRLAARLWPGVRLYSRQREILESVWDNDETFVHAGHERGTVSLGPGGVGRLKWRGRQVLVPLAGPYTPTPCRRESTCPIRIQ